MSSFATIRLAAAVIAFGACAASANAMTSTPTGNDIATARQLELTSNIPLNAPAIPTVNRTPSNDAYIALLARRGAEFSTGFTR